MNDINDKKVIKNQKGIKKETRVTSMTLIDSKDSKKLVGTKR